MIKKYLFMLIGYFYDSFHETETKNIQSLPGDTECKDKHAATGIGRP